MKNINAKTAGIGYLGAIALIVLLLGVSDFALAQTWVYKGHSPALNGQLQAPGIPNRPVAGAVEAVVTHPTDPNIMWIGSVNGGIFRTNNALAENPTWTPQTDYLPSLSISALELDPTDPTHNTLVAGTGRTSSYGMVGGERIGILRTTNGGSTWTVPANVGLKGKNITGVAPRGNIIVVSVDEANDGILETYRSTDGGVNFAPLGSGIFKIWDLVGDPNSPATLFIIGTVTYAPANSLSGVWRSLDFGATFNPISSTNQTNLLNSTGVDANLAMGSAGNLFSAICVDGRLAGVQRSADATLGFPTWTELDVPAVHVNLSGQCGLHLSLGADPTNPSVVYVGGDAGVRHRIDASQPLGSQATSIEGIGFTASNTAPHADSREMAFDANDDLIEVDDGGVYKHTNPRGTDGDWVSLNGNLAVSEQQDVAYDTVSNAIFAGNQDNGITMQLTPASPTWTLTTGGDGADVAVAANDPVAGQSTRYSSSQLFYGANRKVYNSANQLQSTTYISPLGPAGDTNYLFNSPIEVNKVTPSRLIIGGFAGTFESLDRLDTVTQVSTATINWYDSGNTITYGTIGGSSNPNALYFASEDKVWKRLGAPGTAATQTDPNPASGDYIRGVVMWPYDDLGVYAVDGTKVYVSINGGTTWADGTGNLQTLKPGTLRTIEAITSGNGYALVVGGQTGVFGTNDFATWAKLGTNLPNVLVSELDYDATDDVLTVGTMGRGAWTLTFQCKPDVFEPDNSLGEASDLVAGQLQTRSICATGDHDWATFTLAEESAVTIVTSGPWVPPVSGDDFDTYMVLRDSTGALTVPNDDYDRANHGYYSRIERTCGVNALPAGTYSVEVTELGSDKEIETYELSLTTEVCIAADPDLVVENPGVALLPLSPPDGTNGVTLEVNPGDLLTVSATVRNQGSADADATTLRWYQSSDATITSGDTEIATSAVAALGAGLTSLANKGINAPGTPGTYYFGACADPVNGELDTGNNCSTGVELIVSEPGCIDDEFENQGGSGTDDTCYGPQLPFSTAQSHMLCDEDWVYVQPTVVGATYRIETTNLTGGADTLVSVHDECGPELVSDDNSGNGAGSLIEWTAQSNLLDIRVVQAGGVYTITGGYDLTVSCIANCGGEPVCYDLTLSHTGLGLDPVASPTNSPACPEGSYVEGEIISLSGATPDAGWVIAGWSGTNNDASIASTNTATMPAGNLAVSVAYENGGDCYSFRTLAGYVPGQQTTVVVDVTPPGGASVYAVEDGPPVGWTVTNINESGAFDAGNNLVKWGPFFDTNTRSFSYTLTAPGNADGSYPVSGVLSVDGASEAICGDSSLEPGSAHPADGNVDFTMGVNEVTGYGAAWKTGADWPVPPNPIPINYVTNAGFLWKNGEAYVYDPAASPPWVSAGVPVITDGVGGGGGVSSAESSFDPASYTVGEPVVVTILVTPAGQTSAYAVEDAPPSGWTITAISDLGNFDSVNGKVKWGPFFDATVRSLSYTMTPPVDASGEQTLVGTASFDGIGIAISGDRTLQQVVNPIIYIDGFESDLN